MSAQVYEVSDNRHYVAAARGQAGNAPLLVQRLEGRDARDPLPDEHPYRKEL